MKILTEMHLWSMKSPFNYRSHYDLDPALEIFERVFSNLVGGIMSLLRKVTRSSADADNRLDAFSGQSRSTNMVPFHNVTYSFLLCNSNFVFKTRRFFDIRLQKIS